MAPYPRWQNFVSEKTEAMDHVILSPVAPVSHQPGYYALVIRLFSVGCQ